MKNTILFFMLFALSMLSGCASVRVTKTAKGYFQKTNPSDIEILMTIPGRNFIELATVTTQKWNTNKIAKMHNSLRSKCAPLGANAVILGSSGMGRAGYFWASGVAIRYKDTIRSNSTGTLNNDSKNEEEVKQPAFRGGAMSSSLSCSQCNSYANDDTEWHMSFGKLLCKDCYAKQNESKK